MPQLNFCCKGLHERTKYIQLILNSCSIMIVIITGKLHNCQQTSLLLQSNGNMKLHSLIFIFSETLIYSKGSIFSCIIKSVEFPISFTPQQKSSYFLKQNKFLYFIGKVLFQVHYSREEYCDKKLIADKSDIKKNFPLS